MEGDLGHSHLRAQQFALGPVHPAPVHIVGEGQAGGFFEQAAEMGLAQPGLASHLAERQRLVNVGVDETPGPGDGGGFAAFLNDGERLDMLAELFREGLQQGDHACVALGLHRAGFQIGLFQLGGKGLGEALAAERAENRVELGLGGNFGENLAGFQIADDRSAHLDRHGGGLQPGETTAGGRASDFGFVHQAAVGVLAGGAGAVAEVQGLAKWTAVNGLIVQAPKIRVRRHHPQRQPGGVAERVLVDLKAVRLVEPFEKRNFK